MLDPADVGRVSDAGGRIIVAPDTNAAVITAAASAGLVASPGYFTPSEAFAAIRAGATALKLFPAEAATPAVLKSQLAVIPRHIPVLVVGGVRPDYAPVARCGRGRLRPWRRPLPAGPIAAETLDKARAYVAGLKA